jgi:peptide deformylase
MIVQDRKELEIKCSPVSVKEGEEIGVRLLHELRESENGIGLAANQIGINNAFECVCVQHEIDHLDGITMFEREFKSEPLVRGVNAPKKIGRNEKVTITKGSESKILKYKKAEPMLEDGWTLSI